MQDFEMSGKNMNQLIENLVKITESMDTSYNQLVQLLERIKGAADWGGGTKSTFLAYIRFYREPVRGHLRVRKHWMWTHF